MCATKLNSTKIKKILMNYFRFNKKMYVATEVRVFNWLADVLAITPGKGKSIEVEIKISIEDLKADFKNKKLKHLSLKNYNGLMGGNVKPNYLYFCVPLEMLEETQKILSNQNKRYGIMTIDEYNNIEIHKEAIEICYRNNKDLFDRLLLRMSSELVNMYNKYVS